MPSSSRTTEREMEAIKVALGNSAEGLTAKEIYPKLNFDITPKRLRLRMKRLLAEGLVEIAGQGRGTRYKAVAEAVDSGEATGIPLSEEARKVRRLVRRPEQARKPVAYNWEFIEVYVPNDTFYLSPAERARLHEIGQPRGMVDHGSTYAKNILGRLLVDLSWNSSRLEGNSYSKLDTKRLIEQEQEAEGKPVEEARMILNHKDAIEFLVDATDDIGFNRRTILNLHALLSRGLLGNRDAEGRLRSIEVGIGRSVYTPPAVPQRVEECFELILAKASAIEDPFEQSLFAMVHFPYLQPFEDVNKRVSRMAANIPFIRNDLSPLSFDGVDDEEYIQAMLGVYELNRVELIRDLYMWAYERSASRYGSVRATIGRPDPVRERLRGAIDGLVVRVVTSKLNQADAARLVKEEALHLPESDQAMFIEFAESDLLSLHEGNYASYRLRFSEFEEWRKVWEAV